MNADKWIFLLAIYLMCVSSSDKQHYGSCDPSSYECEIHTLNAPLGSSALLPCHFTNSNNTVSWVYEDEDLVHLESGGRIKFLLPRNGRMKAFPNQGSEGNYSICIDELEDSDQGCYQCKRGRDCLQVELVLSSNAQLKKEVLYIAVGTSAFILLIIFCYLFCENKR